MAQVHTIIRNKRLQKGFTQKELADELSVSDKTISKWETGRGTPDITMVKRLSRVLGVSPGIFLEDDTDGPNPREVHGHAKETYNQKVVRTPKSTRNYMDMLYFKRMFMIASVLLMPSITFGVVYRFLERLGVNIYYIGTASLVVLMVTTILLVSTSILLILLGFFKYKNTHKEHPSKQVYSMLGIYLTVLMTAMSGITLPFMWGAVVLGINVRFFPSALWTLFGIAALQGIGVALLPTFKLKLKRDSTGTMLLVGAGLLMLLMILLLVFPMTVYSYHGSFLQRFNILVSPYNRVGPVSFPFLFLVFNIILRIAFLRVEKADAPLTDNTYALNQQ